MTGTEERGFERRGSWVGWAGQESRSVGGYVGGRGLIDSGGGQERRKEEKGNRRGGRRERKKIGGGGATGYIQRTKEGFNRGMVSLKYLGKKFWFKIVCESKNL